MKNTPIYLLSLAIIHPTITAKDEIIKQKYNGNWWISINKEYRLGFLAGYFCCSYYDLKNNNYSNLSWHNIEAQITNQYTNNPKKMDTSIKDMIELYIHKNNNLFNSNSNKYGLFDGEYWRQSSESHKRGFIEGYTICWNANRKPLPINNLKIEQWISMIDKWYGINPQDPSEINEKK